MAELYFEYKMTPYLFDTNLLKLFRLKDHYRVEIKNPEILSNVRLSSIEINRENAARLALEG